MDCPSGILEDFVRVDLDLRGFSGIVEFRTSHKRLGHLDWVRDNNIMPGWIKAKAFGEIRCQIDHIRVRHGKRRGKRPRKRR